MKAIVFGAGLAVGYVLGSRAGRGSYEKLKTRTRQFWESPQVQEKVSGAASAIKDKAPGAQEHLKGAVKKAGGTLSGALHRGSGNGSRSSSPDAAEQRPYSGRPATTVENPVITELGSDQTDTD
jgi:hypothetical protein